VVATHDTSVRITSLVTDVTGAGQAGSSVSSLTDGRVTSSSSLEVTAGVALQVVDVTVSGKVGTTVRAGGDLVVVVRSVTSQGGGSTSQTRPGVVRRVGVVTGQPSVGSGVVGRVRVLASQAGVGSSVVRSRVVTAGGVGGRGQVVQTLVVVVTVLVVQVTGGGSGVGTGGDEVSGWVLKWLTTWTIDRCKGECGTY
jgi:hypothetical protein